MLIVEDNPDGRESMRKLLEIYGFEAEVAGDGDEGVERGLALSPDAAVVDIGLPGRDGFDVARELRRALGGSVLLIAHTAYAFPDVRERAREAGFDYMLAKPCTAKELAALLRGGPTTTDEE